MRLPPLPICASALLALLPLAAMPDVSAQAPAPAATPAAPGKTLFLIRDPDGVITAFRAVNSQLQGQILVLVNEKGGRAVVQARTVVGQLPWFTEEEIASGTVDPGPLAARYELYARRLPSVQKVLGEEAARLRAVQKQRADEAAALRTAAADRLKAATSAPYDADAGYTADTLQSLLAPADALRAEEPSTAETIDAWATPFREHLEKLQSGSVRVNGTWLSAEEIAAQERTARETEFRRTLDAQIPGLALPADTLPGTLRLITISAAVVMIIGLAIIVLARRRLSGRAVGLALVVAPPAILAAAFFLATRNPGQLPRADPADDASVVKLLADAARIDPAVPPTEHTVTEAELNAFLARRVRIERPPHAAPWSAIREALGVRLQPGGLAVYELLRCAGRPWIVRYDLSMPPAGGPPVVAGVKIGALDCPPGLAQPLWRSLEPALVALLSSKPLDEHFSPPALGDGTIKFTPLRPATTATPAEPVAEQPPAPAETPVADPPAPTPTEEPAPEEPVSPAAEISPSPAPETASPAPSFESAPAEPTPTPSFESAPAEPTPTPSFESAPAEPTPAPSFENPAPTATPSPATEPADPFAAPAAEVPPGQ